MKRFGLSRMRFGLSQGFGFSRRGRHEAIRSRGHVQERRAQLLAERQTEDLGALRRTQLVARCQGQLFLTSNIIFISNF